MMEVERHFHGCIKLIPVLELQLMNIFIYIIMIQRLVNRKKNCLDGNTWIAKDTWAIHGGLGRKKF